MTLDEILDGYEDLWRQAMMEDAKQFRGEAGGGSRYLTTDAPGPFRGCAMLIPEHVVDAAHLVREVNWAEVDWRCECGFSSCTLGLVMVHLNNAHDWTWDMLAGKFRAALTQGMAR